MCIVLYLLRNIFWVLELRFCEILARLTHKFNLLTFFSFLNRQICLTKGTNFFHVTEIKVKIMILQCKNILFFFYMSFLMWKIWSKLSIRTGLLNAFTFIFQILGLKYIFTNDWNEYLWISFGFNFRGFTLVYISMRFNIIWCKVMRRVIDPKSGHFLAPILRVPATKLSNFWRKKSLQCYCHTRPNLESNLTWILQDLTCKLGHEVVLFSARMTRPDPTHQFQLL